MMNKQIGIVFLVVIFAVMYSCKDSENFITHEKGFEYRIIEDNHEGEKVKQDDILELDVRYLNSKDSLLFDSQEAENIFRDRVLDDNWGMLQVALKLLKQGDSAHFLIPASDFYHKTLKSGLPWYIDKEETLKFEIRVRAIYSDEEIETEIKKVMLKKEAEETQLLSDYISTEGITIEPTESGLYIIRLKSGSGEKAQAGKKAVVHYEGLFLNGEKFDSTIAREQPFEFVIGKGEVIPAWDEAVATMRIGDKIKIIAPSNIAYGATGKGNSIPPYSTLLFEIKLLDLQ